MKEKPLVSVIMTSYNHASYIAAAIESLRLQDYESWELVIADDASSDNTLDILKAFSGDERIRIFPFTFNRECHVRNFAARQARGRYLAFLNSDDLWRPGKLARQVEFLEENSSHAVVFTTAECIDENGQPLRAHFLEALFDQANRSRGEWLRHFFNRGNCLCLSSAVIRRSSFEEAGGFNPHLIQIGDLDLWIKTCLTAEMHVIREPLTAMRILPGGRNLSSLSNAMASRDWIESQEVWGRFFDPEGIAQLPQIFPELASSLPQEAARRCYALCQFASGRRSRHVRMLAFSRLHRLLTDETSRRSLQEHHCRIFRTLVFSESAASLDCDRPGVTWRLWFPDAAGSWSAARTYSHWTGTATKSLVCFSVPNPRTFGPLQLSMEDSSSVLTIGAIRLFGQAGGELVASVPGPLTGNPIGIPAVNLAAVGDKWIDIEIEYSAYPAPLKSWLRRIKRRLNAGRSRQASS